MKSFDGFRVLNLTRDLWIMLIYVGSTEIRNST